MNRIVFILFATFLAGVLGAAIGSAVAIYQHNQLGDEYRANASVLSPSDQDPRATTALLDQAIAAALAGQPEREGVSIAAEPVPGSALYRFIARAPDDQSAAALANLAAANLLQGDESWQMVSPAVVPRGPYRESLTRSLAVKGITGGCIGTVLAILGGLFIGRGKAAA